MTELSEIFSPYYLIIPIVVIVILIITARKAKREIDNKTKPRDNIY